MLEAKGRQRQDAVQLRRPDPPLPQPLSDDEGELQGLGSVQPRVAVGVVAVAQVVEGHGSGSTDALGHVLPGHLEVDASCVAPFLLVHIEERPYLSLLLMTSWCLLH